MEAKSSVTQECGANAPFVDDTHEAALRIVREREEKDRRLKQVARESQNLVGHELHTSIGS